MCGISGIISFVRSEREPLLAKIERMKSAVSHRGPDRSGTWSDAQGSVCLGHNRLSILDLTDAGSQPMTSRSGRFVIVFNGEIYNFVELTEQHIDRSILRGHSDTEVILELYETFGVKCLDLLRGMFAFAIWDNKEKSVFIARDRIGKKPLYYMNGKNEFLFSSEIKGIKAANVNERLTLNPAALADYLGFGFVMGEDTIYKEIKELLPGHRMVVDLSGRTERVRYWELPKQSTRNVSFSEAVEASEFILSESIKIRLRSDVPVGIFLSGGIDSSIITAIASEYVSGSRLNTITVGYDDGDLDERQDARQISDLFKTSHNELVIGPSDVLGSISGIIKGYDEPIADQSIIPSFMISKYASSIVKVVLNGDGGDELFCGYRRHLAAGIFGRLPVISNSAVKRAYTLAVSALPAPKGYRTFYSFMHRILSGALLPDIERYHSWSSAGFNAAEIAEFMRAPVDGGSHKQIESALALSSGELNYLEKMLFLDFTFQLPDDLLVKMDIATMANGLESRSPFLDSYLVEYAFSIPAATKLGALTTKPILRELARRYLPDEFTRKKKRGFEIPVSRWLRTDFKEMRDDMILGGSGIVADLFHKKKLEALLSNDMNLPHDKWSNLVWTLLVLSIWDTECNGI